MKRVVFIVTVVLAAAFPSLAYAASRTFTHISCTFTVGTTTINGNPATYTSESDSDCFSGINVSVQARWRNVGRPAYWVYSSGYLNGENSAAMARSGSVCLLQASGRARNAYPDSCSSFTTYG